MHQHVNSVTYTTEHVYFMTKTLRNLEIKLYARKYVHFREDLKQISKSSVDQNSTKLGNQILYMETCSFQREYQNQKLQSVVGILIAKIQVQTTW